MKSIKLVLIVIFCASIASAQVTKKPVAVKAASPAKESSIVKAPFLKRNFLLDTSVFSSHTVGKTTSGTMELAIKLKAVKSANISIINMGQSSMSKLETDLKNVYENYWLKPDDAGFTYESLIVGKTYLEYEDASIKPLEYKMVYHGTKNQQGLANAMAAMPSARKMENGKIVPNKKPANEFDTDENNRIMRNYFLQFSPGADKGFLMLSYEANYGDDKNNGGAKALQALLDGISPMKINEQISFRKQKDLKYLIDLAVPDSATGKDGTYSIPSPNTGSISIGKISDMAVDYTAKLESYSVNYGTVINKSGIEQKKLYNGISIYSSLLTIEKKDAEYSRVWYQVVSVLVPDKKIIKTPLLFSLTSFSSSPAEINSMNAFILNSISLPGTLTKAGIDKVKDSYKTL